MKQIEDKLADIDAKIANLNLRIGKLEANMGNKDEFDNLKKKLKKLIY